MTVEKINKWCDNCPHVACETCQITWTDIEELKKDIKDNYISKDKIREYIEEKETLLNLIEKLQEDKRKQSIAIIEYQDLIENCIPKDKIRKKIEELENGEQCYYEFSTGDLVDLLKILLEEDQHE